MLSVVGCGDGRIDGTSADYGDVIGCNGSIHGSHSTFNMVVEKANVVHDVYTVVLLTSFCMVLHW